nr:hypothetical protein BaRGS_013089 [Batillaria attramentaria]
MEKNSEYPGVDNPVFTDTDPYDEVFLDDQPANGKVDGDAEKPKMTGKKLVVVACILLTEMCERMTYYSVVANMVLYGTSVLKYGSTASADIANIFSGRYYYCYYYYYYYC